MKPQTIADAPDAADMPLINHLLELRRRLFISFAAIVAGSLIVGLSASDLTTILIAPLAETDRALRGARAAALDAADRREIRNEIERARIELEQARTDADREAVLAALADELRWLRSMRQDGRSRRLRSEIRPPAPAEPFLIALKIAIAGGIVLAAPVWILQI